MLIVHCCSRVRFRKNARLDFIKRFQRCGAVRTVWSYRSCPSTTCQSTHNLPRLHVNTVLMLVGRFDQIMWGDSFCLTQARPAAGVLGAAHLCEVKGANDHRWPDFTLAPLLIWTSSSPRGLYLLPGPNHLCLSQQVISKGPYNSGDQRKGDELVKEKVTCRVSVDPSGYCRG